MRSFDVVIIIEHPQRELLFIENWLKEQKINSYKILSSTYDIWRLPLLKFKVLIIPWAISSEGYIESLALSSNAHIISLNWEQYLMPFSREYRAPKDFAIRNKVYHYSWGTFYDNFLIDNGVDQTQILKGLDPNRKVLREILSNRKSNYNSSNTILVACSYAWAFRTTGELHRLNKVKGFDFGTMHKIVEFTVAARDNMLRLCTELINAGYNILWRPHPGISESNYTTLINWDHRISFDTNPSIWHSISDVQYLLSSWSSTVYVANQCGVPSALYLENKVIPELSVEWMDEVPLLKNHSQVLTFFSQTFESIRKSHSNNDYCLRTAPKIDLNVLKLKKVGIDLLVNPKAITWLLRALGRDLGVIKTDTKLAKNRL